MPDTVGAAGESGTFQIRVLYSEGCANTPPTDRRQLHLSVSDNYICALTTITLVQVDG